MSLLKLCILLNNFYISSLDCKMLAGLAVVGNHDGVLDLKVFIKNSSCFLSNVTLKVKQRQRTGHSFFICSGIPNQYSDGAPKPQHLPLNFLNFIQPLAHSEGNVFQRQD